ncbi:MAG: bifunctional folylpolyglutamate synthase/dihydrofolate synthase [Chloroflexi bacterium]|nr:bifunctional folylpolyglutamate synthase/dihydrofolate synthase [Chloroflexota bacterium]
MRRHDAAGAGALVASADERAAAAPVAMLRPAPYRAAMAYLASFANYEERPVPAPTRFNLDRVHALCELLGRPERRFPCVQIAGTKGKGSTAAMLESVLRAAGYRVGLYTSPHLHNFRERIRIGAQPIGEEDLAAAVAQVRIAAERVHRNHPDLGQLTTFELTTAAAFVHFAQQGVDCAVLETGLGGRLDAVTVVQPIATLMTSISVDHTALLGDTLAAIAREKAGIVKAGVPLVCAPQQPETLAEIERASAARGAAHWLLGREVGWQTRRVGRSWRVAVRTPRASYGELRVPLLGRHQSENAALALAAIDLLRAHGFRVGSGAIRRGIARVRWPGRLEVLGRRPWLVVDGAHNVDSAAKLAQALADSFRARRRILILGTSRDKDVAGIVRALAPVAARIIATASAHPRAADPALVAAAASDCGLAAELAADVPAALARARALARAGDLICATGSLFVVAAVREALGLAAAGW